MRFASSISAALLASTASSAAAAGVVGAAEGFAKGVTGGGKASPVYPSTNAELVSYLGDSQARVIVLTKTFDFTGSEGTATGSGCAPWGTGSACQVAINQNGWCDNDQASAPKVSVRYDKAGTLGITVKSNKSLVGQGTAGVIQGKGLRLVGGVRNVIIQNIHITNINPKYVWGGDGITLDGTDMIWIDHVKTSLIGRQHIVLGPSASNRVTISRSELDGATPWSATCDGHHYWGLYFTGSNDLVTLQGNYVHHTSGRSPKVAGGNVLLHAVNNYFYASSGHAFEVDAGGMVLAEGNVFQNVPNPVDKTVRGQLFTVSNGNGAVCSSALGRSCEVNAFGSSGAFSRADTGFLKNFGGKNVAKADTAQNANGYVRDRAGVGKI